MRYENISFLLDTDWVIFYLRNSHAPVVEYIKEIRPRGIGISIITLAELYCGVYRSQNIEKSLFTLNAFLKGVTVVNLDSEVVKLYGQEYAKLKKAGELIGPLDLLIGATCLEYGLTLLTNNKKHFERIDGLNIISLEN